MVKNADSQNDLDANVELEDPDNFITLHASTVESKNELLDPDVINRLNEEAQGNSVVNN